MTEKELHDQIGDKFNRINLMKIALVCCKNPKVVDLQPRYRELWDEWRRHEGFSEANKRRKQKTGDGAFELMNELDYSERYWKIAEQQRNREINWRNQ